MATWIVIQNVSKASTGDHYAQVVTAVQADSEEQAIKIAQHPWIWDENKAYYVESSAVLLDGSQVQVVSHESFD